MYIPRVVYHYRWRGPRPLFRTERNRTAVVVVVVARDRFAGEDSSPLRVPVRWCLVRRRQYFTFYSFFSFFFLFSVGRRRPAAVQGR